MERRSFIRNAGIAGVLAAGAAPARARAGHHPLAPGLELPEVARHASSAPPKSSPRRSSDMTGGKFQISTHAAGELMPAFGVVDGVQNGTVEMAHTAPYYFFGKDPTFALGCAIPFGLNSRQMTAWMYEGNGLKLMREFYAKYNIVNFPGGNTGAQMGGWFRKEIKSLADIKGLKLRIGGFGGKVLERIGGVPQNIPGGEIYQALEKGTIDAAEWVGPYDDQKLGFNKVAPFYYYPGWWEGGPQLDFFVNQQGLRRRCRPSTRRSSRRPPRYAHVDMQAKYDARNPAALKQLVGRRRQAAPLPEGRDGRGVQGGDGAVQRARAPRTRTGRRSTTTTPTFRARRRTCGSASPRRASTTSCRAQKL